MKQFKIKDWYGKTHEMSAIKFHKRILLDSKHSDYGWLAPAHEIFDVCSQDDFPADLAIEIKIAILKCFTNILNNQSSIKDLKDEKAVQAIYNEFYDNEQLEVMMARQGFLRAVINFAMLTTFELPVHSGPNYKKHCHSFKEKVYSNYVREKEVVFRTMILEIHTEFADSVKLAEAQGIFKEEDEKKIEKMQERLRAALNNHLS